MILVTGATGFLGRHLVERLWPGPIRVVTREWARCPQRWAEQKEILVGDLCDRATRERAVAGVRTVYHCAGERWDEAKMDTVNIHATRELARAAAQAGVETFLHVSSVGVTGPCQSADSRVTEETPCWPRTTYERTKLAGEQAVLAVGKAGTMAVTVVRPTILFGEGKAGQLDSLLDLLRVIEGGAFAWVGNPHHASANYVYVGDVVEVLMRLAQTPQARGEIYQVSEVCSQYEFITALTFALGLDAPTVKIPWWVAMCMAVGMAGYARAMGGYVPVTPARVSALTNPTWYDPRKLKTLFPAYRYGWQEGVRRTVRWYAETRQVRLARYPKAMPA